MICPTCKSDMVVVEHKRIELDYCPTCQGAWFDSGELELLLESLSLESKSFLDNILGSAGAKSPEKKRICPICHRKMKKAAMGQPGILVDTCVRGDGLWFDGGEVGQLIKQLACNIPEKAVAYEQVACFLRDTFQARE